MDKNKIFPKISVGIPTFNQSKFLERAIESILNQTVKPNEIVISNNHSIDETEIILKKYENHPKIKIIKPLKHLNVAKHFNFIVNQLKSEWFTLLASDDIVYPNFIETLMIGISRDPDCILVRCGWDNIDIYDNLIDRRYILSLKKITSPPRTFLEQISGPKTSFAAFASRKSIWNKVNGFDENLHHDVDWAYWLSISPYGKFIYEPKIVVKYRNNYRPNEEKKRFFKELSDHLYIQNIIIPQVAKKLNINLNKIKRKRYSSFKRKLIRASQLFDQNERQELTNLFLLHDVGGIRKISQKFINGKIWLDSACKKKLITFIRKAFSLIRCLL
ncbi:glycosyltransferase family 2 protein [Stygiobacter electus]|uniref:Glycosyltransferase family 2 protein n=1 Tax=Stygiobacter electus TaxID=3032292 RepID=A0AAE3P2B3_9BACT|nr:glycosyltransferase family 2 protein [Stygiobacter electus]MDF1613094.1 glycosyltransferase family 2 protein [Stygiobacter electus]